MKTRSVQVVLVGLVAAIAVIGGAIWLSGTLNNTTQAEVADTESAGPSEVESALRVPAPEDGQAKVIFEQVGMT